MKRNCEKYIKEYFNKQFSKVCVYQNPSLFRMKLERVNPNHVGIIWGFRKKKTSKGHNPVKVAKVYFELLPLVVGLTTLAFADIVSLLMALQWSSIVSIGIVAVYYLTLVKVSCNANKHCLKRFA